MEKGVGADRQRPPIRSPVAALYERRRVISHSASTNRFLKLQNIHLDSLSGIFKQVGKAYFFEVGIGCSYFANTQFRHASK